jgi:hypothetical protein
VRGWRSLVGGAVGRSEAEGGESVTESHRGRRHRPDGGLGRLLRALPSFPTRLQKRSQIVVQLLQPIARSELIVAHATHQLEAKTAAGTRAVSGTAVLAGSLGILAAAPLPAGVGRGSAAPP